MKKNTIMRIAAVVLMCTLVTACFASSTFAKYTSAATATGKATVAKWDISVEGNKITISPKPSITFNLTDSWVNTVKGSDGQTATVKDNLLAPGTNGYFDIDIKNDSDVYAKAAITLSKDTGSVDLPSSFVLATDGNFENAVTLGNALPAEQIAINETKTVRIYWKWTFETTDNATDEADTAAGIAAGDLKLKADIVVDQVD